MIWMWLTLVEGKEGIKLRDLDSEDMLTVYLLLGFKMQQLELGKS